MHSRLSFFLTALLISSGITTALATPGQPAPLFSLQVASFPDLSEAGRFAVELVSKGENPVLDTVEIEGRGYWTRIFVGLFDTPDAARRYGVNLVARRIIREFLVKKATAILALSRPRRVSGSKSQAPNRASGSGLGVKPKLPERSTDSVSITKPVPVAAAHVETTVKTEGRGLAQRDLRGQVSPVLPIVQAVAFRLAPRVDTHLIPRPDALHLAFRLVAGEGQSAPGATGRRGGLWLSGDTAEGLERLRWIAGDENKGAVRLEPDGRVSLDRRLLAKAAGLRGRGVAEDPLRAAHYISSNEGLLLLVQVAQGRYRYLLHIGRQAPTSGKSVEMAGSVNLDNNADSRINPYRKNGRKVDAERPPEGFDSLIGLNPIARWFNLSANYWVQPGEIMFHELAEAYAKLEGGLDYLDHGSRTGAHTVALNRETRLKAQRPGVDIVMTAGSNRLLRTEEEIRLFYAEASGGSNQR